MVPLPNTADGRLETLAAQLEQLATRAWSRSDYQVNAAHRLERQLVHRPHDIAAAVRGRIADSELQPDQRERVSAELCRSTITG